MWKVGTLVCVYVCIVLIIGDPGWNGAEITDYLAEASIGAACLRL